MNRRTLMIISVVLYVLLAILLIFLYLFDGI